MHKSSSSLQNSSRRFNSGPSTQKSETFPLNGQECQQKTKKHSNCSPTLSLMVITWTVWQTLPTWTVVLNPGQRRVSWYSRYMSASNSRQAETSSSLTSTIPCKGRHDIIYSDVTMSGLGSLLWQLTYFQTCRHLLNVPKFYQNKIL